MVVADLLAGFEFLLLLHFLVHLLVLGPTLLPTCPPTCPPPPPAANNVVDCPTQLICTRIFHDKAKRTQQRNLLRTMAIEEGWGGWPAAFRFHSQPSQPWQLLSTCRALTQPPTISLAHPQYLSHHICHFFTITILRTHNLYLTIFGTGLTHNLTQSSRELNQHDRRPFLVCLEPLVPWCSCLQLGGV